MLESKLERQFEYSLDINPSRRLQKLISESASEAGYLLQPEDTSSNADNSSHDMMAPNVKGTRDMVKTLFWISVSIAATIAMGQLH
ncbi:hypothetical protein [Desulforhopalus sp. 52FAK]